MLPYEPHLGKSPSLIPISNSEIQTYKDCRRKWYLSYYLGLGGPQKHTGALAFGTRVHRALEVLYKTGENPLDVWSELIDVQESVMISEGLDLSDLTKEAELGRIMLEGYLEWVAETGADSDLEIVGVEKALNAKVLNDRVELRGKIDMRVKRRTDKALIPFDFKTVAQYDTYIKIAHMAEQLKLYNLLEMINADEGEFVGGGKYRLLKKVKRSATAKPPFYRDFDVRHNKHTLNNFWISLHGVLQDMVTLRDQLDAGVDPMQVAYPSPTNDCTWKCPFYTACPLFDDGSAVVDYVQDHYTQYDPYERYKEDSDD